MDQFDINGDNLNEINSCDEVDDNLNEINNYDEVDDNLNEINSCDEELQKIKENDSTWFINYYCIKNCLFHLFWMTPNQQTMC
ncbi:1240_t:CDS:2 [Dentiscutata erythropus]|uniref:1240_t:CDS:1 n=1 Tax=Dentiscutata erythropus TaxID=1348616 RepID=A0A9N9HNE8_9GLOM|nr:1240_t:CDS:2 [Dentiscutata erythropus]